MAGDDHVGTGTFYRCKDLHHDPFAIDPAVCGSRLDHREFAADVVSRDGHVELVPAAADDVQVRKSRFYHHDVGSFPDILSDLTHRLVADDVKAELGITDGLLRLSVGLEDVDDLWGDLVQALSAARVPALAASGP